MRFILLPFAAGYILLHRINVARELMSGPQGVAATQMNGGFAMGSFEWMELQTLTSDINASRSRLAQARSHKDHRLIRMLEGEIGAAEGRRDRLLADISTHLAGTPEPATEGKKAKVAE